MQQNPACVECALENVYPDGDNFVCADCGHEWSQTSASQTTSQVADDNDDVVRDSNGVQLANGDSCVLIKSLKVKGSTDLKQGTKVTNIRLVSGDHEVDCKINNVSLLLKAEYLRKV